MDSLQLKYICYFLLPVYLTLFSQLNSACQNAPVTTATIIGNASPGPITVPITVTGFNNIGAISLTLEFDHSVLNFVQGIKNPLLPGSFVISDNDQGNGLHRLTMGWFGSPAISLPDNSSIMDLQFTYISGTTSLEWIDNGGSCEYADGNYIPLNDIPTGDFYINGYVCGVLGTPGPVTGNDSLCQGRSGEPYSIAPVPDATGYVWSVPEGANIITGQNTTAITVDFTANAVSGIIGVYATNPCGAGPSAALSVTVNVLPVANAGTDTTIFYGTSLMLHAAQGGSGSFSYHWSPEELLIDPDVQNPQTVNLTATTIFSLTVTNQATLCLNTDEVTVTITGGPLSVNPVAIPSSICRSESAQLYSNAGGGSENYTYQWTCNPPGDPPWSSTLPNPLVTPDTSTHYFVVVNDGFNTSSGSTFVTVFPLPGATISGGDTLCGANEFTLLPVVLTGIPPWNFTYSYGSTTVFVNNQQTSPYYITAYDPGDYTITAIEDANCTGTYSGSAIVRKYPIPAKPEITVNLLELISSSCCGNQWYLNDTAIPGATGQNYIATESGMYFVIVTLNGCSSEPSEAVDIIVGIEEYQPVSFSFYPNPFNNYTTISYILPFEGTVTLEISSILGNIVTVPVSETQTQGGHMVKFDTNALPSGVYTARLRLKSANNELIRTIKLINN